MDTFDLDAEELKVFLQETDEQIQLLDEDIIRLEREPDNAEILQEIFRAAHTLKGSSGMLGFKKMAGLTHAMEDTLDKVRSGKLAVTPPLVDALLEALDALKILKEFLASGEEGDLDIAPLVAAIHAVADSDEVAASAEVEASSLQSVVAADAAISKRLDAAVADGLNAYVVRLMIAPGTDWAAVRCMQAVNELTPLGELICSVPSQEEIEQEKVDSQMELILATSEDEETIRAAVSGVDDIQAVETEPWSPVDGSATAASGSSPDKRSLDKGPVEEGAEKRVIDLGPEARGKSQREQLEMAGSKIETQQTVRIDIDRLDALMNMVGELVIDRTRVVQISKSLQARNKDDELVQALAETSDHISKIVGELNDGMMQVRMLPIDTLFNKFPRLVRDLSRGMDKDVDFITEGGDTEIDRSVIEKIKDPLVHLLRNAIDHGVEDTAARKAAGKPAQSQVKLTAYHQQGNILITLEDDGKGIDAMVIREAAIRKGVVTAEVANRLSDAEAIDLIFEPGMSTKEQTTEVSGRGVGMDVVRRSIGAVNGVVKIDTKVGVGTTFTLQLPLTLATFRGLLVESGGAVFAIPLNFVQETGRLESSFIETIIDSEVVNRGSRVLPLLRLSMLSQSDLENGRHEREGFMVIVQIGDKPVAVAVDALREQQEIVVKTLGAYIGQTEGIAGASILGDGQVVLILDVASLLKAATQGGRNAQELERRAS